LSPPPESITGITRNELLRLKGRREQTSRILNIIKQKQDYEKELYEKWFNYYLKLIIPIRGRVIGNVEEM
jgi:hypothetical protein